MADWSTVAIAAITGLAGLSGNALQTFFASRNQAKGHEREDALFLRAKLEEMSSELDEGPRHKLLARAAIRRARQATSGHIGVLGRPRNHKHPRNRGTCCSGAIPAGAARR